MGEWGILSPYPTAAPPLPRGLSRADGRITEVKGVRLELALGLRADPAGLDDLRGYHDPQEPG